MKQRTHHRLFAGTVLGATLALAAVAGAAATESGEGHGEMMENGMMENGMMEGGMMEGGMMGSMHKMMSQCNDMMASMQEKHDMQSGDEQSTDDAS